MYTWMWSQIPLKVTEPHRRLISNCYVFHWSSQTIKYDGCDFCQSATNQNNE